MLQDSFEPYKSHMSSGTNTIMYNAMTKQFAKDFLYRENIIDTIADEEELLPEECDEEYGDAYDNIFEDREAFNMEDILPSLRQAYSRIKEDDNRRQTEEDTFMRLGSYAVLLRQIVKPDQEEPEKAETEQKKYKGIYLQKKETDLSWKYPIYHKAIHNLQIEAMLAELYDQKFDEAQREYLIYRFGLKSMDPQKPKDAADHYNLTLSYAKKIEKAGISSLRVGLRNKHLL